MASDLVSVLRDAAQTIRQALTDTTNDTLQSRIDDWAARHGVTDLDNRLDILAHHAALQLLLQATLHDLHNPQRPIQAIPPAPHALPVDSDPVLNAALRITSTHALSDLAAHRQLLHRAEQPAARIGTLFEQVTPREARQQLGQFCTPPRVASLMASWLTTHDAASFLDPGIGAGALTAAVSRHADTKPDTADFGQLHGIDVTPLARLMSATALRLHDHAPSCTLHAGDFLEMSPDDIGGPVDALICNPPYTRHQALPEAYKQQINARAEDALGRSVTAQSPLYAYWLYHAASFLAPGGRAVFLTPAEFLDTDYGEPLKQHLVDTYRVRALALFDPDGDSIFRDATTTTLITCLEKPESTDSSTTTSSRFIKINDWPGHDTLRHALSATDQAATPDWGTVTTIPQAALDPTTNWSNHFTATEPRASVDTSRLRPLGDLATIRRGILTGKNAFFCLSQAEVTDWGIDEQYLAPLIRSSRFIQGYTYTEDDWHHHRATDDEAWLLYHLAELADDHRVTAPADGDPQTRARTDGAGSNPAQPAGIIQYLQHGLADGVHDGHVTQNRDPWFLVDRRDPAPILVSYMSRSGFRAVHNQTTARHLNNLHGLYPTVEFTDSELKALLAFLNSEPAETLLQRHSRTYSGGLEKLEPSDIEHTPVLDPRKLPDTAVQRLAAAFDSTANTDHRDNPDSSSLDAHVRDLL